MKHPYDPAFLPITSIDHKRIFSLVARSNAVLARYDGLLRGIVNPELLLSPLTTQEAVISSKIEGTQATLDEVLEHEAGEEKRGILGTDIQEIINYRKALIMVKDYLRDNPITLSVILNLHATLMDSVRGKDKSPGNFRTDQNWIGKPGCTIEEASYIPPSPLRLLDHLENLQTYIEGTEIDPITQTAIIHAQFELIHPFKDGNGRIGRLLIPLVLYRKQVISSPMFYISAYLEKNRDTYYDRLEAISNNGDWNGWIEFFMTAVINQAEDNSNRVQLILNLYADMKTRIVDATHSHHAIQILDAIFARPVFQTSDFIIRTTIPKQTALPILKKLKDLEILRTIRESSGRKPGILAFPALLDITEGRVKRIK
jgi:Fic family protein